ncbi:CDP-diacylglycerol--glycerol-3-phosphate 3-phosphatidyltransferase [Paramaledivibacter caminithermalis]|jgi:cardiolipin synthase|uniref:CDP-diacylglycerol--glycerol-3-phosphate 3-phosphatidyltransferase n=1 Tax=Paramaledivibacter caminithermalis (strain DSM 15212 / CIP 107654 / DViRD3) TaxID=1121301 RepID=A0A1M6LDK4_PARC5|nr:CDP-diacylglycerol--glycerol-3-phosphate 3-phosphatidyltransferase [Paramaledivibacter caminithermalis]SHJ69155.1 CDP-diacylglycerol--glycerol-3-phosphate 3-phosphatidyltransferase [Paramaledivibacter caminithermalis DSM 15212]
MNLPNILTTIRFLLVPLFIYIFFHEGESNIIYATYIFILAGITDVLDGYIARKYNLITKWGQAMDPLADKLMLITVLICFTIKDFLPIWVIIIVGLKEILMILGGLFLYYKKDKIVIPANKFGKMATVIFYIAILYMAFGMPYSIILISFAIIFALFALIKYMQYFRKLQKDTSI